MTTFGETEGIIGTQFFPFDDGNESARIIIAGIFAYTGSTSASMDTTAFDQFRQGVELTNAKYLYQTTQPKLWAGNLSHATNVTIYGQARTWTQYTNKLAHDDILVRFDVTRYITDPDHYPTPYYFNDGPQTNDEAIIEPLTIPYRKTPEDGAFPPHSVKASLEDGNTFDTFPKSANRVSQFVEYAAPITPRFFLDAGQEYIGSGILADKIVREGWVPLILRQGAPFNDTKDESIVGQLNADFTSTGNSAVFIKALNALKIELDEDIREEYTQKSAPAGYSVYGPGQARYGTDSLTFVGLLRGS